MIVSIQSKVIQGPWGGGNLFVKNLINYLIKNKIHVLDNLYHENIDVILMTDPLKNSISTNYSLKDIKKYKRFINPNVKIVHRINECDERKNTKNVNNEIIDSNDVADSTVFVSEWLRTLYENLGLNNYNQVIISGSDKKIFNNNGIQVWDGISNIKIVTHHWGTNINKGFEIYQLLDQLIYEEKIKGIEFTYIGNLPKNFKFNASQQIKPLHGLELAKELKKHNIYLTASKNEPSGNHHIEGAQCGLPVLYLNSGGVVEYCKDYGVSFENQSDFQTALNTLIKNYEIYFKKIMDYPNDSENMCFEYLELFRNISKNLVDINKNYNASFNIYNLIYKLNKIKSKLI